MSHHPAIKAGRVAVITGGAGSIGLAAADHLAGAGMKVVLADLDSDGLSKAGSELAAKYGAAHVRTVHTDVSEIVSVQNLFRDVRDEFGDVSVLINNSGTMGRAGATDNYEQWHKTLGVNFGGVLNGVQTFVPAMKKQSIPSLVINTGSKQGITCPPGNLAYNTSKAAVKVLTEGLQHELRNTPDCKVQSVLFVPGWTWTNMTGKSTGSEKPAGAFTAEETVSYLFNAIAKDPKRFYVIVPDNDTSERLDQLRMAWSASDVVEGRPPLSRWSEEYKDEFAKYIDDGLNEKLSGFGWAM